jgi:hypothetical protein
METRTEELKGNAAKRTRKVVGRQDKIGQEAIIDSSVIKEREQELVRLYNRSGEAQEDLSTAIKKTAEDSGFNAAAVRRYITAKAGDDFDKQKKHVQQLALIFDIDA